MSDNKKAAYQKFSRRSFLKGAMAAGSALALAGCNETVIKTVTVPETVTITETIKETVTVTEKEIGAMPSSKRIVFNAYDCTACLCCEMACSSAHYNIYSNKLSAIRISADFVNGKYEAYVCKQCEAASCVAVCPVDAIKFDEETGARYIVHEDCAQCGKCIEACPFIEDKIVPIREEHIGDDIYYVKCDLCHGREGGPACVEMCPRVALTIED